eukprot:sb/3470129/
MATRIEVSGYNTHGEGDECYPMNPSALKTNQSSLFRSCDWLSANQGPVFPVPRPHLLDGSGIDNQEPTETSKQPIKTRYFGHLGKPRSLFLNSSFHPCLGFLSSSQTFSNTNPRHLVTSLRDECYITVNSLHTFLCLGVDDLERKVRCLPHFSLIQDGLFDLTHRDVGSIKLDGVMFGVVPKLQMGAKPGGDVRFGKVKKKNGPRSRNAGP